MTDGRTKTGDHHIHIMTAGGGLFDTFKKSMRCGQLPMDEVIIIGDGEIFSNKPSSPEIERIKESVRDVELRCKGDDIPCEKRTVNGSDIENIMECVIDIRSEKNKSRGLENVRYYSNVTGGGKILSIGLFQASIWIDAIPYYFYKDQKEPVILRIPKFNPRDISKNPNYIEVLRLLEKRPNGSNNTDIRKNLKYQVQRESRSSGKLTMGNLSKILSTLEKMELIKIEKGKNRRENRNIITQDGKFTLKILK
jgi:hypothetical protein